MSGPLVEVTFSVKGHTKPGEVMCVVGDCPSLGEWNPQRAHVMDLERRVDDREIWQRKLSIPANGTVNYRFLIATLFESDSEGDGRDIAVMWWETNLRPRKFNFQAYCQDPEGCALGEAEFGSYDGRQSIDKGWLIRQTEIHLRLHSNPIYMWKARHRQQIYSVKCTALDITNRDMSLDDDESNHDLLPSGGHNKVTVSLYDGEQDVPSEQPQFGTAYQENDYMVFRLQTFERESLGYQFDFYLHDPNGGPDQVPKHVGSSFYLSKNLKEMQGISEMPINGLKNKPIGHLTLDYLIISPLSGIHCNMHVSFARHWKASRRALDVGHRGMGSSYGTESPLKECESVKENTIRSLAEAGGHGADFVEFDVQLTKDKIPVIYHDLKVSLTLKKKHSDELEWFDIPLSELNLEQLQMLKLDHPSEKTKGSPVTSPATAGEEERQLFPTLRRCLELLDPHLGFYLEVKYCMQLKTGGREEDMKYFLERNEYIDIILTEVLRHAGERRIILHSFDPDICTMMRVKQNFYPVMFNPLGNTSLWTPYDDLRCGLVAKATNYAHGERLLGLNVHTEDILKDCSLIGQAKKHNMILFCWGADLNSKENIKRLKQMGVDAVIYDGIAELKDNKENVFKMEKDAKLRLLRNMGVITSGSRCVSPNSLPPNAPTRENCTNHFINRMTQDLPVDHLRSDDVFSPVSSTRSDKKEEQSTSKTVERHLSFNGALNTDSGYQNGEMK